MDYKKSSFLLKKINSLHHTLAESAERPSSIEMDLMRSYLRDFYDSFVNGQGDTDMFETQSASQTINVITETPNVVLDVLNQDEPQVLAEPILNTEPTTKVLHNELDTVEKDDQQVIEPQTQNEPEAITDQELIVSAEEVILQIVDDPVDQDLLALFADNPAMDLSDKLGMLPVRDLSKALSINDRYFTIQELFGGDAGLFQHTLSTLNSLSSFDEASKELMASIAKKYDWASDDKKQKATNFIRLVRRRYQS